jgi:hypothetical protein
MKTAPFSRCFRPCPSLRAYFPVLDLPFLFRDAGHAHRVLDGNISQGLLAMFERSMIRAQERKQLGIDPVFFGVVMVVNLSLGLASPPSGATLFVSAAIAGIAWTGSAGRYGPRYAS